MRNWLISSLSAVAITFGTSPAFAEWPNDKPIKIVIPYGPGGGFDTIVRAFTPALEKALSAEVVPENISGAGGTRGAATVARAKPDGYTIGIFNMPGFTVTNLTGGELGFDLDEVTWISNLETQPYAVAVKADSPIESLEDLCNLGRPATFSEVGAKTTSYVTTKISFSLMNCPVELFNGYKGSNDAMIGLMRGDVDATVKPVSSLKKYVESGDLRMLVTYTDEPVVKGVPSSAELGHKKLSNLDIRRVMGAPPGLPADIQKRLSSAFLDAANSPEIQEWASKSGTNLEPRGYKEASQMVRNMSDFYAQYKHILATE